MTPTRMQDLILALLRSAKDGEEATVAEIMEVVGVTPKEIMWVHPHSDESHLIVDGPYETLTITVTRSTP